MRRTDYLFLRPGSRNWHIKLQSPTGRVEKSLGTPDRVQAEILALPMIAEHKVKLLEARPRLETTWRYEYEPGREHVGPNGGRIIANDQELIYLDTQGHITRRSPNGGTTYQLVGRKLTLRSVVEAITGDQSPFNDGVRPRRQERTADDAIIATYLEHANITGHSERETRAVWALYKQLTDGKPLKDATRDDGRKLVQHFEGQGLRSATIQKKITWLNAAVNLAIKESKLTFNPFSSIVPKRDDKQKRLPLSEDDIKNAKRNLGQLGESDQLLFRLLAATGMRLSEAFEIDGEMNERGCRYVIIGKKTPQSHRRVPLPAAALPYLPKVIKGPLFEGGTPAASKRLNKFIRRIGIVDKGKVVHSLRHRAQDRLRAAGCPVDYRWAILGHEEKTVAEGYGEGFPVPLLKKWIDKIGF
ncbi:MAG: tyrosine-type recombinase/integrase [Steroidobacteraceae bacterium]